MNLIDSLSQDPEKNKLGESGLWLTAAQRRKKEKAAADAEVASLASISCISIY